MMSGMSGSLLSTFYPGEALKLDISVSTTGHVFGVRYVAMIITSLLHTRYLGRCYSTRTCLTMGLALTALG